MQDKFYDSDLASINQKDFLSDTQPPKDQLRQKKLLKKTKFNRIYKSIYKIGLNIDKPAKYDLVSIRYNQYNQKPDNFVLTQQFLEYNLGICQQYEHLQDYIISMKKGEVALFEIQKLRICGNTGMKILDSIKYYVIELKSWITTIDLDGDRIYMKQIIVKGEGNERVSGVDQIKIYYRLIYKNNQFIYQNQQSIILDQQNQSTISQVVSKIAKTMKNKQQIICQIKVSHFKNIQAPIFIQKLKLSNQDTQDTQKIKIYIKLINLYKVDDIYFDKTLFKKTIRKGNSTAKPQRTSLIYFALKYYDQNNHIIKKDQLFDIQQQSLLKLQTLNVRAYYLDQYRVSRMLKNILIRMKPLQIAEIICKQKSLIKYGQDCSQLLSLFNQIPNRVKIGIKVFNFSEGKSAYNMQIDEKIMHGLRKKEVGIRLLKQNNIKKALKTFEQINAFFCYGIDSEQDKNRVKDVRVSSLLNTSLCYMKQGKYDKLIQICNKIKDIKVCQKCIYRLAYGYKEINEYEKGLEQIEKWQKIEKLGNQMLNLKKQLKIKLIEYKKKAKLRYANMFTQ